MVPTKNRKPQTATPMLDRDEERLEKVFNPVILVEGYESDGPLLDFPALGSNEYNVYDEEKEDNDGDAFSIDEEVEFEDFQEEREMDPYLQ